MGLGAVFHDKEAVPLGNFLYLPKFERLPIKMNPDNRFRLLRYFFFYPVRIYFPCILRTVHKNRSCPCIGGAPGAGDICIGRNDYFIPFPYSQSQHCQLQGRSAIIHASSRSDPQISSKFLIEFIGEPPSRKSRFLAYSLYCL